MAQSKGAAKSSGTTVEGYIRGLTGDRKHIVSALVALVRKAAPKAMLSIKWSQPVFEQNGPFCYVRAFTQHVNFGFWRGVAISSGKGMLQSGGEKMAHIKIRSVEEIDKPLFTRWVQEAVKLNETQGDPTKRK